MTDQFVAEIRMFGFDFAPTGWALCDGQILPVTQNTALFSLLGTQYGGNGQSTFALPDMRDRAAMHQGQGAGLSQRWIGEIGGTETVTLIESEMPAHSHALRGTTTIGEVSSPTATTPLSRSTGKAVYHAPDASTVTMAPQAIGVVGGSQPHNNLMPYLVLNFCIALQGVFPQRP